MKYLSLLFCLGFLSSCGSDPDFYLLADHAEGVTSGSTFTVSGIEAGEVTSVELTANNRVRIGIDLEKDISLPDDTRFERLTTSVFGGQAIDAVPGRSRNMIAAGDELEMGAGVSSIFQGAERMLRDGLKELKDSGIGDSLVKAIEEGKIELERALNDEELKAKIRKELEEAQRELEEAKRERN